MKTNPLFLTFYRRFLLSRFQDKFSDKITRFGLQWSFCGHSKTVVTKVAGFIIVTSNNDDDDANDRCEAGGGRSSPAALVSRAALDEVKQKVCFPETGKTIIIQ